MMILCRKISCFILVLTLSYCVEAQSEEKIKESKFVKFTESIHDFGRVNQAEGDIKVVFTFVNKGTKDIKILDVVPECGCTLPDLTLIKDSLFSFGQRGELPIQYEASTHPGEFDKRIDVYTNLDTFQIGIRGYVVPDQSELSKKYPESIGLLRFEDRSLQFGKVFSNKTKNKTFNFYNPNEDSVSFDTSLMTIPKHLSVKFSPEVTPPNAAGHMIIAYDPIAKADYGYSVDYIRFFSNLDSLNFIELPVRASIEEFFDPERDVSKAPKFGIDKTLLKYKFPETKSGDLVTVKVPFENSGLQDLLIHTVKATCSCVQAKANKSSYKPGQKGEIEIEFDTSKRNGMQRKQVVIYANDPLGPVTTIQLEGKVAK